MKIALVYGGQPRFTYDFLDLMTKITGFESASFYIVLWKTDWADTDQKAHARLSKILKSPYSIGKITVVDEPIVNAPAGNGHLESARPENVMWWYTRQYRQTKGLSLAFDLIDQEYDAVIRFRGDGSVNTLIDLSKIDLKNTPLILPNNAKSGHDYMKVNDQFAIGNYNMMKFYCGIGKEYESLVPQSDPLWNKTNQRHPNWKWGAEHLMGYRFAKYNVIPTTGNFGITLNSYGRSKFTDKHFHHSIARDPTE